MTLKGNGLHPASYTYTDLDDSGSTFTKRCPSQPIQHQVNFPFMNTQTQREP